MCASFAALDEHALIIEPDGDDAGDVVLASPMQLSVRYHPLHTTSPNITDSVLVLVGQIDADVIKRAGQANAKQRDNLLGASMEHAVRQAVEVDVALQRRQFWRALPALYALQEQVLQIFALAHGGMRPHHTFQALADTQTQALLGATLPTYSLQSVQDAFVRLLDLLEHDSDRFTRGQAQFTNVQRHVLRRVHERQATLDLGS